MKLPIYQVDAFTSRLFGGNPAAVILLDEWLPDPIMQNIGRENNLSEDEVRAIMPDFDRIAALGDWMVIVTAQGRDVDYVFRVFAPGAGIPEDPATGSAHCTLIPYWASRLGKSNFTARQISNRVGEFTCELRGNRVQISGMAVEYLQGEIDVG